MPALTAGIMLFCGGPAQIRTGDKGVADLCLTTWRRGHICAVFGVRNEVPNRHLSVKEKKTDYFLFYQFYDFLLHPVNPINGISCFITDVKITVRAGSNLTRRPGKTPVPISFHKFQSIPSPKKLPLNGIRIIRPCPPLFSFLLKQHTNYF